MSHSEDPFRVACDALASLRASTKVGQVLAQGQAEVGALLGFAIDSETLQPQALMEARDLQLRASPAVELEATDAVRSIGQDIFASSDLTVFKHRKGGVYTRAATFMRRGDPLVLYICHKDGLWWLRPEDMFYDGRFTKQDHITPLSIGLDQ